MDLRGKESDVIMWDSSMTENSQTLHTFFMKTALISGNRAPFLMSYFDLREFGKVANADVGYHGEGWNGPETRKLVRSILTWLFITLQTRSNITDTIS